MQAVYTDGTLSSIKPLENAVMDKWLSSELVDHVKIFNENGNNVGTEAIQDKLLEKRIENMVEQKIKELQGKKDVMNEYKALTGRDFQAIKQG